MKKKFLNAFLVSALIVIWSGCKIPAGKDNVIKNLDPEFAEMDMVMEKDIDDHDPADYNVITGKDNTFEWLMGTEEDDYIDALGGGQFVYGHGGNDVIITRAPSHHSTIFGGPGNDFIYAADGEGSTDIVYGGEGNDRIYCYKTSQNFVAPGPGIDRVYCSDGEDYIHFYYGDGMNNRVYMTDSAAVQRISCHLEPTADFPEGGKTRIYLEPESDRPERIREIYIYSNDEYTVRRAYYDKYDYTNFYIKVNGKVRFIITVKKYTSDPDTHWAKLIKVPVVPEKVTELGINPDDYNIVAKNTADRDTAEGTSGDDYFYNVGMCSWWEGYEGDDVFILGTDLFPHGSARMQGGPGNDCYITTADYSISQLYSDEGDDQFHIRHSARNIISPGPGEDRLYLENGDNTIIFCMEEDRNLVFFNNEDGYVSGSEIERHDQICLDLLPTESEEPGGITTVSLIQPGPLVTNGNKMLSIFDWDEIGYTTKWQYGDDRTKIYIKSGGELVFTVTIFGYTSDQATHWIEIHEPHIP